MAQQFVPGFTEPLNRIMMGFPGIGYGIIAEGSSVPVDGTAGYEEGCLFFKRSGTIGAQLYINEGSQASCLFHALGATGGSLAGLLATAAELNRTSQVSSRLVASGASLALTQALHDGKTIVLAAAAAITLPVMSGSGSRFRFVLPQDATAVTITATAAHLFGALDQNNDTAQGTGFQLPAINAGGATVITLDGITKGGRKGDWIEIEDIAASVGTIRGQLNASGTEASPFS